MLMVFTYLTYFHPAYFKHLKNNFPLGKDYILPDIVSPETIFSFLLVLAP